MSDLDLTPDQHDALQEMANIGMGQAGEALARLLDTFVNLSVPRIEVADVSHLGQALNGMAGGDDEITAVRQSFRCDIRGEAIVVFGRAGCTGLWDLMGYERREQAADAAVERELLFDVANVLVGACLCGIFEQLGRSLSFSPPSMMGAKVPIQRLLDPSSLPWRVALMMQVDFRLEGRQFTSHLLVLMPEDSIGLMKRALDHFLSSL